MPSLTFDLYARGEQRVTHAFRNIRQEADKTERSTRSMGKAWGGLSTVGGLAGKAAIGLGLGIAGAGAAVVAMTDDVVGLNLQVAKARVVFGSSFAAVDQALSKTASKLGITRIEGLGLAATVADMAKQTGFATRESARMSLQFVDLVGRVKLLSAGQFDAAAASEAVSAAFRGEYDSLQRVVPAISAERVETVAANIAKKSSTKLSEDQAKMLAVLKIVQEGTATSSALLATAEGKQAVALEQSRTKMREAWQELQVNLLPTFVALWSAVSGRVNPALKDFSDYLASPQGKKAVQEWTATIGEAIGTVGSLVGQLDDVQSVMKQMSVEARIAWLKVGLAVQETKATFDDAIASIPGMGDGWKQAAKDAHAAAGRIRGDIDKLETDSARLEVDRLQRKYDSLHGKLVEGGLKPGEVTRARREMQAIQGTMDRLRGRAVNVSVGLYARGFTSKGGVFNVHAVAQGGPIGTGRGTVDEVPLLAMRGEHMLTTKDVDAMGGHSGVYAFRRALHSGGPRRMAAGGDVTGMVGPVSPAGMYRVLDHGVDRIARVIGAAVARGVQQSLGTGSARGWAQQWALVHRAFPGASLFSAFRPGAITSSGNRSYHSMGRAIDITPSMGIFNWIAARYGANTKELIFSPAGSRQIKNGRPHYYSGEVRDQHWSHVHWAMDAGGVATGPGTFVKATTEPERVLSPAQTRSFDRLVRAMDHGRLMPAVSAARPVAYHTHVHINGVVSGSEQATVELVSRSVKAARRSGHLHRTDFT